MFEDIIIIYKDEEVLVIDKPAGIVVSSEGVIKQKTLEDWIKLNYPKNKALKRSGVVHRLDKGTSGLMVIALSQKAQELLSQAFKKREVQKRYLALAGGDVCQKGEVSAPIKRSKYTFSKWKVDPDGKNAWTIFKVLQKYKSDSRWYSLIEVDLKTGRTHQIRVHLSYLGWPLVGDKLYGGETRRLSRPFLHACHIGFKHPTNHKVLSFDSDLRQELEDELAYYEKL